MFLTPDEKSVIEHNRTQLTSVVDKYLDSDFKNFDIVVDFLNDQTPIYKSVAHTIETAFNRMQDAMVLFSSESDFSADQADSSASNSDISDEELPDLASSSNGNDSESDDVPRLDTSSDSELSESSSDEESSETKRFVKALPQLSLLQQEVYAILFNQDFKLKFGALLEKSFPLSKFAHKYDKNTETTGSNFDEYSMTMEEYHRDVEKRERILQSGHAIKLFGHRPPAPTTITTETFYYTLTFSDQSTLLVPIENPEKLAEARNAFEDKIRELTYRPAL